MKKLIILGAVLLSGCGATKTVTKTVFVVKPPLPQLLLKSSGCHAVGMLPDPQCTPGVIDPRVTQQNIHKTICVPGYTQTVRPSSSLTNRLKRSQIAAYGYADTNPSDYEEDHLISLELGGAPADPKNLWPESPASPNPKDKIENLLHKEVCSGKITLKQAQQEISTNWTSAH